MQPLLVAPRQTVLKTATPIRFVAADSIDRILRGLDSQARAFVGASGFTPKPGRFLALPGRDGGIAGALFGIEAADAAAKDPFLPGRLCGLLPPGTYRFANAPHDARLAALAFALEGYRFGRYRKADAPKAKLVVPDGVDGAELDRIVAGVTLARDLINTPSNDMRRRRRSASSAVARSRTASR